MLTPLQSTTTSATLPFNKHQNANLTRIPATHRIQKRPIPHNPHAVASPYAGAHIPKIVYVGSKTPFMSAVKRVQKLLRLAERRAMAPVLDGKIKRQQQQQQQQRQQRRWQQQQQLPQSGQKQSKKGEMAESEEKVLQDCLRKLRQEKVLIKATGRAIEKALSLGRWFQDNQNGDYEVGIRTGSVCVVDDIVRVEEDGVNVFTLVETPSKDDGPDSDSDDGEEGAEGAEAEKDTAMGDYDLAGNVDDPMEVDAMEIDSHHQPQQQQDTESKNQRRRRRRRERERQQRLQTSLDSDGEPPESRTRWVSMIEVAVSLK